MKITKILVSLEGSTGLWEFEFITPDGRVALSQMRVFSTVPYESGKVFEYISLEEFQQFINRTGNYDDL